MTTPAEREKTRVPPRSSPSSPSADVDPLLPLHDFLRQRRLPDRRLWLSCAALLRRDRAGRSPGQSALLHEQGAGVSKTGKVRRVVLADRGEIRDRLRVWDEVEGMKRSVELVTAWWKLVRGRRRERGRRRRASTNGADGDEHGDDASIVQRSRWVFEHPLNSRLLDVNVSCLMPRVRVRRRDPQFSFLSEVFVLTICSYSWAYAADDGTNALELDPTLSKAYWRRASARRELGRASLALAIDGPYLPREVYYPC